MVDIGKIKIRKKTYQFDTKKRFQPVGHYRVKKKPPLELLKDQFRAFLTPKKEAKKAVAAAPQPTGFNFVVFGAALLIAFIILGIGWIYLTTQVFQSGPAVFQVQTERPSIQNTIQEGEVLTSGQRGGSERVATVFVDYSTENLNNYTVRITTYEKRLPSQVFILNSERFEATTYSDFLRLLRADLAKRKIILNEITVSQLETMPEGAIVIVPSGIIPAELLGFGTSISMNRLADRGMVVIYVGQPFTKMLNKTLVVSTPQATVSSLPVNFDERAALSTTDDFHLYQPLYRAGSRGTGWASSIIYGSVSVVSRGDGAFIFIPQTLDGGWRGNFTSAADDLAKMIFDTPWVEPTGPANVYEFSNQTGYSGSSYFFSNPFKGSQATVKAEFIGYSPASNYPVEETLFSYQEKTVRGELYIEEGAKVIPTNITGERIRLNAKLQEAVAAQPNMLLAILDNEGNEVQAFPQGNVDVQAEKNFDIPVYVDKGEYIVKLVDDAGKIYAQTYMKVVSIDITHKGSSSQKRSIYLFDVTMDGNPVDLNSVTVKIDSGRYGTYSLSDVRNGKIEVDVGSYTGGDTLPFGDHTFEFTAGGLKETIVIPHAPPKSFFNDPLFWVVIILTVGIVALGVIFARQETVFFSVDIPDFPPVARTKIPLSPDVILSIFQKVNENYRWQNTPLTEAEIKNGFRDIFYKGRPVYVTDYNVEYLLDELEKKRSIRESMGYYGLVEWEDKTKRSINYLAMLRRLRDICVNNAVPFTSLGESEAADSEITVVGQQMFLHFYEKGINMKELLKRALPTISRGITIIVFKSEAEKEAFKYALQSPSTAPLIAKMESDSGSLQFLTMEEFEKMLVEFKSM